MNKSARSEALSEEKPDCSILLSRVGLMDESAAGRGLCSRPASAPAIIPATWARLPAGLGPATPVAAMASAANSMKRQWLMGRRRLHSTQAPMPNIEAEQPERRMSPWATLPAALNAIPPIMPDNR